MEEDEGADAVEGGRGLLGNGGDVIPCPTQKPDVPCVLVLKKGGLDELVCSRNKSRGDHGIVFEDKTDGVLMVHHPLPDRDMGQGTSHASDGV